MSSHDGGMNASDPMEPCSEGNVAEAIANQTTLTVGGHSAVIVRFVDIDGAAFAWSAIAQGLHGSEAFRAVWNQVWADVSFDFQWKPVPIHPTSAKAKPFFAVLVPATFEAADASAYQPYLQQLGPTDLIADFLNLSGDARLVVPRAMGNYGHIAAFCRSAPVEMYQVLWGRVGKIATAAIQQQRAVWCNTHGHGVPWMHVRFDRILKYTAFPPSGVIDDTSQAVWYQTIYAAAYNKQSD